MVSDAAATNPFAPDLSSPSAAMDTNPLATPDTSDNDASAPAASAPPPFALANAPPASAPLSTVPPAPLLAPGAFPSTVLQTIDIWHHVPVTLDLHAGNYAQWRRFFLTIVDMFGVRDHLVTPAAPRRRDPEWVMVDHCVVHWLYSTVSPELLDTVMQPDDTADVLWAAIEGIFRDNNLSRAVYLDAEYHVVVQGDLTVMQYCTRLKSFATSASLSPSRSNCSTCCAGSGASTTPRSPTSPRVSRYPRFLRPAPSSSSKNIAPSRRLASKPPMLSSRRARRSAQRPRRLPRWRGWSRAWRNRRRGRATRGGGLVFGSTTLDSARSTPGCVTRLLPERPLLDRHGPGVAYALACARGRRSRAPPGCPDTAGSLRRWCACRATLVWLRRVSCAPPRVHLRVARGQLQQRASTTAVALGHGWPSDCASGRALVLAAAADQHLGLVHGFGHLIAHDLQPWYSPLPSSFFSS